VVQRKPTATSRGAVGRKYVRDARGRFAGSGYTGQTSGKGARLMASGTRKGGGSKITLQKRGGTVSKPQGLKPGSIKPKSSIGSIGAKLAARDQARGRGDGAAVNLKLSGTRGKRLDAEISRNVKAQKVASRTADKARNKQFKSEQSRAKKLRDVHVPGIAKAKGISTAQVESALRAQTPGVQIKALKNWVKQNRTKRNLQSAQARKDRSEFAKDRKQEASFLKTLPKGARRAVYLASKTRGNVVGAKERMAINEGATMLRSDSRKRKKSLSPGQAKAVASSIQHSGRKLRVRVAEPRVGGRLKRNEMETKGKRLAQISGSRKSLTLRKRR